uniref:Uncharacterized protein n=2 Tax=viral metagenome TaxID=1070528 RepID=A0A6M3M9M6_9ZZZZ
MMPSNLVRVTLDKKSEMFTVEYGEQHLPGLSELEEKELSQLNEDLIEYSDFTAAENLEDEARQQLMSKKKRLEELTEKRTQESVNWHPVDEDLVDTLLIILSPQMRHTYVENLPPQLLEKLLEPQMTFNFGTMAAAVREETKPEIPPEKEDEGPTHPRAGLEGVTSNELAVIQVLITAKPNWTEYVSVKEEDGVVYVRPHKFLGDDWGPVNAALKKAYGESTWKSKGAGDRDAHWEVEIK